MKIILLGIFILILCLAVIPKKSSADAGIYSFQMRTIDGKDKKLADYKGKTLLIVNTASKCGYTPQYQSLEALYEKYKDKGLEVLAFPANNFRNQEPGTDEQIKGFCLLKYRTTFSLFSKISVAGENIHPLYKFLTSESGQNGPIPWNFTKFLVSPDGQVVARFEPKTDPLAPEVTNKLEEYLQ